MGIAIYNITLFSLWKIVRLGVDFSVNLNFET